MTIPIERTYEIATADTDFYAANVTTARDVPLLNNSVGDGLAHRVTVTSTVNLSAVMITIIGLNEYGRTITETRAMSNNNTVSTTAFFSEVSEIFISQAILNTANAFNVGFSTVSRKVFGVNYYHPTKSIIADVVSGTVNYSIEVSGNRIIDGNTDGIRWAALSAATTGATTDQIVRSDTLAITFIRITINSTSGTNPTLHFNLVESIN